MAESNDLFSGVLEKITSLIILVRKVLLALESNRRCRLFGKSFLRQQPTHGPVTGTENRQQPPKSSDFNVALEQVGVDGN